MNGFEAYKLYLALKRHFTPRSTYDFVKYNGKVNANANSFEGRKDKVFFLKLAKHPDVMGFLVANLSVDPKAWIGSLPYSAEAQKRYTDRQKRVESLTYNAASELGRVEAESFDDLFISRDLEHPALMTAFLAGDVSLETMIALDEIVSYVSVWKKKLSGDPIAEEVIEKIEKGRAFLQFDREKMREVLLKKFS